MTERTASVYRVRSAGGRSRLGGRGLMPRGSGVWTPGEAVAPGARIFGVLGTDAARAVAIAWYFVAALANMALQTIFGEIPTAVQLLLFSSIIVVFVSTCVPVLLERGGTFLIAESIAGMLFAVSFFMGNSEPGTLFDTCFWVMGICVPVVVYATSIKDVETLLKHLTRASYVVIALLIASMMTIASDQSYSMSMAMTGLPFVLLQCERFCGRRSIVNALFACAGIAFLVLFGNRGAVACLLFYMLCKVFHSRMSWRKRVVFLAAMLCVVVAGVAFLNQIVAVLADLLISSGLDTYTVRRFLNGTWFVSAPREVTDQYYLDQIQQAPIMGYGICGSWISAGGYPHNGFLWLLLAFGVIIGGILCVLFVASFVRVFFRYTPGDASSQIALCFCAACFSQLISAELAVTTPTLYIFIMFAWLRMASEVPVNEVATERSPEKEQKARA